MSRPTYPTLRVLTIVGALFLAACVLALMATHKPADAAFPGKNGKILFSAAPCGEEWPEHIGSVNPDGTGYTVLTDDSCGEYGVPGDVNPEASPDGKKVAFTRWNDTVLDIFVMNADGSEPKNLTDDALGNFDPAWSPDGKEIAFASGRGGSEGDIYVVNADGTGEPRRITDRPGGEFSLAWSPDGSDLLYVSSADTPTFPNPGRDTEIYAMNPDGSGVSRLTDNTANDSEPDWSPNGNAIVFSSNRDGGENAIYTMKPNGSEQAAISYQTPFPCYDKPDIFDFCYGDFSPVWSPDGTRLAFVRFGSSEGFPFGSIYTMNPDGSGVSQGGGFSGGSTIDWAPAIASSSECTIRGTRGDDELTGTQGDDVICGFRGRDTIRGLGGDDTLLGNKGDERGVDAIYGGSGDDTLRGGNGRDELVGGGGRDLHDGGLHDDRLDARDWVGGNDVLVGSKGEDVCLADPGDKVGMSCEK